ncbi:hypothetical protein Ahy_B03g066227 [Arachis hypogaea]|uniref:Zinc finger GRF-type domain-containing protein n=1 Tax=Arachis hypogaea TaxID=3818 RepID=A0A445A3H5_ARAHY|nr:hypothetical protein Ahy_B03g066227 [Arachis hypogaea]
MSNSRERGSGRDASIDQGRSISVSSVSSVGVRKKKRFVTPKCNCGIHVILFMSSTQSNPNRLSFGCPYFKTAESHCKYFLWLDAYVSLFEEEQINDYSLYGRNPKQNHLLVATVSMEEKVTKLEDRVSGLELQIKNSRHVKCIRDFSYPLMALMFVFKLVFASYLR